MRKVSPVRVEAALPVVLSPEEVARVLQAAPGLKGKAPLSLAYGARGETAGRGQRPDSGLEAREHFTFFYLAVDIIDSPAGNK